MIALVNAGQSVKVDKAVADALFLRKNPGFRLEDLGYPKGDVIIVDLMRLID